MTVEKAKLQGYVARVADRWPVEIALLGGTRALDAEGQPPLEQRSSRHPGMSEYVVVLVSPAFDGVPWLERVYQAESLWDAFELGAAAEVHCYTPVEFERKRRSVPAVRQAVEYGIDMLAIAAG
jgi:hypothetical protein